MSARSEYLALKSAFVLLVCLLLAGDAGAYVLPGPEFFGQFMALATWALVAFSSVMLYPLYALIRFLRGRKDKPEAPKPDQEER